MTKRSRPDYPSRTLDAVSYQFEYFGEEECPQVDAHLYRALCRGIAHDRDLLAMAARAPSTQPAPNLLFGAVHYLLLGGEPHALRAWYPDLAQGDPAPADSAFAPFRSFCLEHRPRIEKLIETRLTQTNELQRCSALLPAFAHVLRQASTGDAARLALIEIGPSAGLNLHWDRFGYRYDDGTRWGDPGSGVIVDCALRGANGLPDLPVEIPVAWRRGVDIHPVDVGDADAVQWLRALLWPDHPGRQERLTAAIEIARVEPPQIVAGDAAVALPALIEAAPADATLCIYGTHTLYQFPRDALVGTLKAMQQAGQHRPVHFVSIEGTGDGCSELQYTRYEGGARETTLAANCNPHGRWLEWLAV